MLRALNIILAILTRRATMRGTDQEVIMDVGESEFDLSLDEDRHICHIVRDWAESRIAEIVNDPNQNDLDAIALEREFIEWLEYDGTSDLEYLSVDTEYFRTLMDHT